MRPATRYGGIWRVLNKQKSVTFCHAFCYNVCIQSLKFIWRCINLSAYHCLYDLPETHQSKMFSAISFCCSSVKLSGEELSENPCVASLG